METAASFEARFAPSSYPTGGSRGWKQPAKTSCTRLRPKERRARRDWRMSP